MPDSPTFKDAVVECLLHNAPDELLERQPALTALVARVLDEVAEQQIERLATRPSRSMIEQYLADIRAVLPSASDRIALVYGGATKIKDYVFEAPKLPEIRGASALLDWVNKVGLNNLWFDRFGAEDADRTQLHPYIIYASGGGFLAFAPADLGEDLARDVERCYIEHTLTANSVAVSQTFSLLELRYGRLGISGTHIAYWFDNFQAHWDHPQFQRQLEGYYYGDSNDSPDERFFRRKTFGELVTLLTTMTNRRRAEHASHGGTRNLPFYQLLPWAERCDSSDVRPAVFHGRVGDEAEERMYSRASGFKRAAGQLVKNEQVDKELKETIAWSPPAELERGAWHQQWLDHLATHPETAYAKHAWRQARPARDVHEIGAASKGYIGMIYADGNNVGWLIASRPTPKAYQETSEVLSNTAKDAVFQALAECLEPAGVPIRGKSSGSENVHPFEILTIGGDDLLLIVPGDRALDIALAIGQAFEQRLASTILLHASAPTSSTFVQRYNGIKANVTPSIGLSAGVVIAQETAPIFFLRGLVEELLKNAKERAQEHVTQGYYGGAVDFMVMKSISMVTNKIKSFRQLALGDGSDRRLTARPYSWYELSGLLTTIRALKSAHVPRSQLYRLRRVLDEGSGGNIVASVMEYLYTRTLMSPAYSDALQKHIEQSWCWNPPVQERASGLPPWMPLGTSGWETIWPDLLEAYEMVPQ